MPEMWRLKAPNDGMTAAIPSSTLDGRLQMMQKIVSWPCARPKGVTAVTSNATRPPQKSDGRMTSPVSECTTPQPYGWNAIRLFAVQLPLNVVPSAPLNVKFPLTSVAFGWTLQVPWPVTESVSPAASCDTFGTSMTS